jgi:alkanesulfonate monooxygenase SsuD/methylene tetrahydromethanopterin reductase-like flavin-dependent oxidoreductase (luciferase family)
MEREHRAYGIPFPPKRFGLLEESLKVVTGLWGTPLGETFSFAGEHYRLEDAPALPKPMQARVPLIIGGMGPSRTPALAARFATEYNAAFADEAAIAAAFDRVRSAAQEAGRPEGDLRLSVAHQTVVGRTDQEFRARAERIGADPEQLRAEGLGGTTAEVVDRVGRYGELGADRVYLQVIDMEDVEHLEVLAEALL